MVNIPRGAWPCGLVVALLFTACQISPPNTSKQNPSVELRPAPLVQFRGANSPNAGQPGETDSNSPMHWAGDVLHVFHSAGHPWRSSGSNVFHLTSDYQRCQYDNTANGGRWIECTWAAEDGVLYGWYHLEPWGICPGAHPESPKMNLTAPKIGALRSTDNGLTWRDLGIVLSAPPDSITCATKNYYFAGGHGDFSVMLDHRKEFLYFFISTYPKDVSQQGVAVARMRWSDRDQPAGKVWKWRSNGWNEPGVGGEVTPIFSAAIDWHRADADAFWGPSIHWNRYLRQYVILLNRARDGRWTQEGIYVSFNPRLENPFGWTAPQKILDGPGGDRWYPQVAGLDAAGHETDKLAGHVARLFIRGQSKYEIVFRKAGERR